ncbi:hypothetical protein, unlikely [Trypanosoma congolense IL3000]|uniref:Uncharacterized protein n=1 Tax=Trypanosoma congolense (strain IL3000) TaxID=1068625 RepID=F9W744_TRYCI|nr:hypothetical protein, unlikely [Trypanosoma congolense IL3000]
MKMEEGVKKVENEERKYKTMLNGNLWFLSEAIKDKANKLNISPSLGVPMKNNEIKKNQNYYTIMDEAKMIKDKILKNQAEILLRKSKAWIAYSRDNADETSNIDDMNVSHFFDVGKINPQDTICIYIFHLIQTLNIHPATMADTGCTI